MRIVNAVFSKQCGGLEQACLDYAQAMRESGHAVTMLVSDRCRFMEAVAEVGNHIHMESNRFGKWDAFATLRLRRWLEAEKPDAVLAHGKRAVALLRRAVKGIAPLIAVNHSLDIRHSLRADAAIAMNEDQKRSLQAHGRQHPDSIHVVPKMVTLTPEQRALRISNAPQSPPVIGVLSRLVPVKAVHVFLDALGMLRERGVALHARIGGDGPSRAGLQEQADRLGVSDRVEFLGQVADRQAFYESLDIFCLPSREESFDSAVLEAFRHKLPVVATNCTGVRHLSDGRNVTLMVPVEDAAALADAIERLLAGWPLAQRLAAAGYALIEEKHDAAIVSRQLERVLERVVAQYATARGARD